MEAVEVDGAAVTVAAGGKAAEASEMQRRAVAAAAEAMVAEASSRAALYCSGVLMYAL